MSSLPSAVPVTASAPLLDKYVLPKVALTVITLASFVGVWLTMSTHGAGVWWQVSLRWLHLISFAALTGGYMWKGLFIRPAEKPTQQPFFIRFAAASQDGFRRIVRVALPIFLLTALVDAGRFSGWGVGWLAWAEVALLVAIALAAGWDAYGRAAADAPFGQQPLARLVLGLLLLDALVQAGFDVTLAQGGQVWPLLVRWLHLAAFGLWFGGALWNIFIAVPAARQIVSLPVVVAASQQLERFRVAVRLILPTLILTGLAQSYPYVGLNPSALATSPFGRLILIKIVLILVLVAVFLTCPMWRACSPIAGMCKLDDLYAAKPEATP
ncbi:MAG: CopD family protein [Caldilineales bacterium]|nr:CopD family protein [Caldilineales bacterium]